MLYHGIFADTERYSRLSYKNNYARLCQSSAQGKRRANSSQKRTFEEDNTQRDRQQLYNRCGDRLCITMIKIVSYKKVSSFLTTHERQKGVASRQDDSCLVCCCRLKSTEKNVMRTKPVL